MKYTCQACSRELVTRANEQTLPLNDGAFPPLVPYVAVLREDDGTNPAYCCAQCADAHDSPGAFQAYSGDRNALGIALILHALTMNDSEDDQMSSEGWGHFARIGRHILHTDDRGFISYDEYRDSDVAGAAWNSLYDDGAGASEFDAFISHERGEWQASIEGKTLDVWQDRNGQTSQQRAIARVRLESMRTGYYPNLWYVNDHGNVSRIDY